MSDTLQADLAAHCMRLESELSAMTQRAEAAEARIKASQEQEPFRWLCEYYGSMNEFSNEYTWIEETRTYKPKEDETFRVVGPLYAAPVIPPDVADLQRENAKLARKLADSEKFRRQYFSEMCEVIEKNEDLLTEAKHKDVPEFQTFNEWMHKEIPSGTIIGDSGWWASRIYRKFIAPSAPQPETDRGSNE